MTTINNFIKRNKFSSDSDENLFSSWGTFHFQWIQCYLGNETYSGPFFLYKKVKTDYIAIKIYLEMYSFLIFICSQSCVSLETCKSNQYQNKKLSRKRRRKNENGFGDLLWKLWLSWLLLLMFFILIALLHRVTNRLRSMGIN